MQLTLTIPKLMKWATGRNLEIQSPVVIGMKMTIAMIGMTATVTAADTMTDMTIDADIDLRHRRRAIAGN